MFESIKEAYDKYILMDSRMKAIEDRLDKLEVIIKAVPDPFKCPKCDKGKYRPTGNLKSFGNGASEWQCDSCEYLADVPQCKKLSSF